MIIFIFTITVAADDNSLVLDMAGNDGHGIPYRDDPSVNYGLCSDNGEYLST